MNARLVSMVALNNVRIWMNAVQSGIIAVLMQIALMQWALTIVTARKAILATVQTAKTSKNAISIRRYV